MKDSKGVRGSEGMLYCFRVPTTSVGQGVRGSEGEQGGVRG